MHCTNCKGKELDAFELECGLIAARCHTCEGSMLSLLHYRYWLRQLQSQTAPEQADKVTVIADDSGSAHLCPRCGRLMTKFRIDIDTDNRLDLCGHCEEVWLDKGEWSLLKSRGLHTKLTDLFTDSWQRKLRKQQEERNLEKHYAQLISEEDFARVREFKHWLDQQEHLTDIRRYLNTNF